MGVINDGFKKFGELIDKSFLGDLLLSSVNRKNIEKQINTNKELYIKLSDLLIENILGFRNNLIVLLGGLIALLGFLLKDGMIDNYYFYIGILFVFSSIFSSIIIFLVTLPDIQLIKKKMNILKDYNSEVIEKFKLSKELKLGSEQSKEYIKISKEYEKNINNVGYAQINIIGTLFSIILAVSLIGVIICFMIYYIGGKVVVWYILIIIFIICILLLGNIFISKYKSKDEIGN